VKNHAYPAVCVAIAVMIAAGGYLAGERHLFAPSPLAAADDCQTFPETGWQVCGAFLNYWKTHGGLAQQGYPISSTFQEKSETDGKTYTVQYFERAVFEAHPENQPPNDVLLSLLGSQKYKAKYGSGVPASVAPPASPSSGTADAADVHLPATSGSTGKVVYTDNSSSGAITFVRFVDPAKSTNQFEQPQAGNKYVAMEVIIQNTGTVDVSLSVYPYLLRATDGFEYPGDQESGVGQPITTDRLTPGGKRQGFVVFEVPSGAKPKFVRYKPDGAKYAIYFDFG
jgi:hypothetical protein